VLEPREATPTEGEEIIVPQLRGWKFAERERTLLGDAGTQLPTWRLANFSRKTLASVAEQLSEKLTAGAGTRIDTLDSTEAQRHACISLAAMVVRNTSGIIVLVGCGYERESLALGRTNIEALIRGRQAADDASGDVARTLLQGRRPRSLKAAAERYGSQREVALLDRFAHADLLSLRPVSLLRDDGIDSDIQVLPLRGQLMPATQLLETARTACAFTGLLAEVFGVAVEVPRFVDEQLRHYRDNPLPSGV
jgi:hypothetical protein